MTALEQAYSNLMARIAQCMQDGNWAPVEASARNLAREAAEAVWMKHSETVGDEDPILARSLDAVNLEIDELGGNDGHA